MVLALTRAVRCERPSRGQELTTAAAEKASEMVFLFFFLHTGMNLTLRCQLHGLVVCVYMWQLWGSEREEGRDGRRQRVRRSSGQIFVSLCRKAKLLPDLGTHPCAYPSRLLPSTSSVFFLCRFSHSLCLYCGWCGGPFCWAAWHRTMSAGKPSLSRIPRSLWQSSSSMKPYQ